MSFTDFIHDLEVELDKYPTKGLKALRRVVRKYDKLFRAQARDQRSNPRPFTRADGDDDEVPF